MPLYSGGPFRVCFFAIAIKDSYGAAPPLYDVLFRGTLHTGSELACQFSCLLHSQLELMCQADECSCTLVIGLRFLSHYSTSPAKTNASSSGS